MVRGTRVLLIILRFVAASHIKGVEGLGDCGSVVSLQRESTLRCRVFMTTASA